MSFFVPGNKTKKADISNLFYTYEEGWEKPKSAMPCPFAGQNDSGPEQNVLDMGLKSKFSRKKTLLFQSKTIWTDSKQFGIWTGPKSFWTYRRTWHKTLVSFSLCNRAL